MGKKGGPDLLPPPLRTHPPIRPSSRSAAVIGVHCSEPQEISSLALPTPEGVSTLSCLPFCSVPEARPGGKVGKGMSLYWPRDSLRRPPHPVYQGLIIDSKHMRVRKW